MSSVPRPRLMACALASGAAIFGGLISAGPAVAAPGRAAIPDTHPQWAVRSQERSASVTTGAVNVRVYLAGQDPAGLAAYAKSVSDPTSSTYGSYLTPGQVQSRFGATDAQVSAVKAWLTGSGLSVTGVTRGIGAYVAASGSVAEAGKAFGVSFADYKDPSGATARAPQQTATVPSTLADTVLAVSGLDTGSHQMRPQDTLPPPGPNYWVAPPTSDYYGQKTATGLPDEGTQQWPWNVTGYTPQQIRGAYNVAGSGMTGRGQTVAIVDAYASPTMLKDANEFSQVTGNQPFRPGQYQQYLPSTWSQVNACGGNGWYGEETLDVESVHDMAPDANVHYVAASSCTDADLATADATIVNQHLASIVSNSWGEPAEDATITPVFDLIFQAGAAEGIGFYFSSGDSGYEDPTAEDPYSSKIQVDYPTSSPWVTSVGGTSLAIGQSNNYEWETSWGTLNDPLAASGTSWTYTPPPPYNGSTYDGSSGGGVSTMYSQPWYQRRVVPGSLATSVPGGGTSPTPMRVVPDVSALADPSTGMLVGQTTLQPDGTTYAFSLSRIGGTSVASPTFAGIQADAQQAAGHDLGFANPAIYARAGSQAFHDVTDHPLGNQQLYELRNNYANPYTKAGPVQTNLRALGIDGEGAAALPATTGYDDSTGVGSPDQYIQSFLRQGHHRGPGGRQGHHRGPSGRQGHHRR